MTSSYFPRTLSFVDERGERHLVGEDVLAAAGRAAVVLGEPGMGKTRLLLRLGERTGFHYIPARAFIRRPPGQRPGEPGDVLVIDALDEVASAREEDPVHKVLGQLVAAGMPSFVLSCRSVEWRGAMARHDIAADYGQPPLELRLEPLSQDDAVAFLAPEIGDAQAAAVVKELANRSFDPFYGNPLTLSLIAKLIREDGKLPATRADLYARSSDILWREHDERRGASQLSNAGRDDALDAAGAACAALIITGSEGISFEATGRVAEGDLHVADVAALPGAGALPALLGSGLFVRPGPADRVAPLHRSMAEYLGARWLARKAPEASQRRVLGLLSFSGGVPASLRGLHAWLAHFSRDLAAGVIAADPYGVLRYGDASQLSPGDGRLLLQSLQQLSKVDPYFRSEDWARHEAPSLVQPALLGDVRRVLVDPDAEWQFRLLVLDALNGATLVSELTTELLTIVLHEDRLYGFAERRAAADALLSHAGAGVDWDASVAELTRRPNQDSRRLAVEIIAAGGAERFSVSVIVDAVLSYLGLLPGYGGFDDINTVGPLYILARRIPVSSIPEVLDQLAAAMPPSERLDWEVRHGLNDLVHTLIRRQLSEHEPEPLRLLTWMRIASFREGGGGERRRELNQRLRDDVTLRRAIQRHALLIETGDDGLWARAWRLQELESALYPTPDDVIDLLAAPEMVPLDDPVRRAMWRDLVQISARSDGYPKSVLAAARAAAKGDEELLGHLKGVSSSRIPDWERQRRKRDRARARALEKKWTKHRQNFGAHEAQIRAGEVGWIAPLAEAYFGRFHDIEGSSPRERISGWLGEPILVAALEGFEAVLHRSDLPSSEAVANSYAESKRWNFILPILAGICERAAGGRGFEEVPDDVILTARLGFMREHVEEENGGEAAVAAIDAILANRPDLFQRYACLAIEPQLRKPDQGHISGLYELLRTADPAEIVLPLATDWLRAYPGMASTGELELLDYLARHGRWDVLRETAASREQTVGPEDSRRLTWLAIAFLSDFERRRADLDAAAAADSDLFWHIRDRGGIAGQEDEGSPHLTLERLAWLVRTFRTAFPARERPRGVTSGNENAWDATQFLVGCIRRIASDTSDAAIAALAALQDDPRDGYTAIIQNARADQRKARREADFAAPALAQLAAVIEDQPPRTAQDLKAIALDALDVVQRIVRGDEADAIGNFYDGDVPRTENACRDQVLLLLRGQLPFNIDVISERDMPGSTRADLTLSFPPDLQLPIEAKGQWHPRLWTAIDQQLDALYTTEWRAGGVGVYLVFWFGVGVSSARQLRAPPGSAPAPSSAGALQAALTAQIPEHRRGDLVVFVLDVSR